MKSRDKSLKKRVRESARLFEPLVAVCFGIDSERGGIRVAIEVVAVLLLLVILVLLIAVLLLLRKQLVGLSN